MTTAAMKVVRTGFGLNVDGDRRGLAGFRVVVLQCDLGFANGIEIRIYHNNAKDRVLVIGPIQLKIGAAEMLAVDEDLPATLRIFGSRVAPAHQLLRSG